jgi:hypothetical protein
MNAKSKIVDPVRGLSRLMWPCYSPGLLLQAEDLAQAVTYTRELSRLMFRTLFGCGVLCGLVVSKPKEACGKLMFTIDKGVALDCMGDPIEVPKQQTVSIDLCTADGTPKQLGKLWFVLCRYDKCCAPRTTICAADDDQAPSVCTRERDGFEIRVIGGDNRPDCACGCDPAPASPPAPPPTPELAARSRQASRTKRALAAEAEAQDQGQGSADCVDCTNPCHTNHYAGNCPCDCCDCDCVILALASKPNDVWCVDHSVRRFVRPVLMRDPRRQLDCQDAPAKQDNNC